MSKPTKQFRPYLTSAELIHILNLLKADSCNLVSARLHSKLALFNYKIQSELVKHASVLTPRSSTLEALGADEDETRYLSGQMNPEEESAYLSKLMGSGGG